MSNIIIDALNYYFEKRKKFRHVESIVYHDNTIVDLMPTITINGTTMKYNIIGVLHEEEKTFSWAWHLNILKRNYIKTKQLLIHSINTTSDTLQSAYVRRLLTSSTIDSINSETLTTLLSLATYLTKADAIITSPSVDKNIFTIIGCYDITKN